MSRIKTALSWLVRALKIALLGIKDALFGLVKSLKIEKAGAHEKLRGGYMGLSSLIGKKVYTDEGEFVGNVKDIILEKHKIYGLKVKVSRRSKLRDSEGRRLKGILVKMRNVGGINHIVLVDHRIEEHLSNIDIYADKTRLPNESGK